MKIVVFIWILRLIVAILFSQALYFKFTGTPESVYVFSTVGVEPYGRIGTGIAELITVVLVLIPRTTLLGALIGFGVMIGAILSHLFALGMEVQCDGRTLFILALITFISCSILIYLNKTKIPNLLNFKF
jgi:uncharacterized membrane protein YphA (DoxX/SURF4 family)